LGRALCKINAEGRARPRAEAPAHPARRSARPAG